MSLLFTNETYNGGNFLSSNVGKWVAAEAEFLHFVSFDANVIQSSIIMHENGGVYWVELLDGSEWSEYGYADGKSVTFRNFDSAAATTSVVVNIDYLDGELMFVDADPSNFSQGQFPTFNTDGTPKLYFQINQTSAPEKIEFDFNLTKPNAPSLTSLIDGNINRFKAEGVDALAIAGTMPLTQINSRSGGLIKNVVLTYVSTTSAQRIYKITYDFLNWTFIQNGNNTPTWFDGVGTVGAINRIRVYAELNNPNTVMETSTQNTNGNCGGFNENFNTGIEQYTLNDVVFKKPSGEIITGIDYGNTTIFEAVIDAPVGELDVTNSRFSIGMSWIPTDETEYQNKLTDVGVNLGILAPTNEYQHAIIPNPTQYNGYINPNFRWSFKELQFEIVGDTVIVSGEVFPTVDNSFFDTLSDGEKKHALWVSCWRNDVASNQRLTSSIKLFDADVTLAPELGVVIKLGSQIIDHNGNIIRNTTTEDDVLINLEIDLIEFELYENIKAGFQMYNTVTEEFFYLEQFSFSLDSTPYINGKFEVNQVIPRNFNLPPTSDRNKIELVRNSLQDNLNLYRVNLNYGWLNDWRYWMEKSNANLEFFDASEPNNGLNKNWQKYTQGTNWVFRFELLVEKGGVSDFYYENINIKDYDDEDITPTTTFVDLTDNSTPSSLVNNTIMEVTTNLEWNTGVYQPFMWAEVTIEDFESGNRWVLSSILEQGNISSNPLKSTIASDKLELTTVDNIATLKYKIDTNIINAENVSISSRIYSGEEITDFRNRIIADGGTFESEQCLTNIINKLI